MEMWSGIWTLRNMIPLSGLVFLGVICVELLIKFIQKKKINFKILRNMIFGVIIAVAIFVLAFFIVPRFILIIFNFP